MYAVLVIQCRCMYFHLSRDIIAQKKSNVVHKIFSEFFLIKCDLCERQYNMSEWSHAPRNYLRLTWVVLSLQSTSEKKNGNDGKKVKIESSGNVSWNIKPGRRLIFDESLRLPVGIGSEINTIIWYKSVSTYSSSRSFDGILHTYLFVIAVKYLLCLTLFRFSDTLRFYDEYNFKTNLNQVENINLRRDQLCK